MSGPDSNSRGSSASAKTTMAEESADKRRDDTFMRLRSALLQDRLAVVDTSAESSGTDPYNSGVHRALARAHAWSKRAR